MNKELLVTNSNPIVKLKTFTDAFVVHWFIGKRCNFDCSYCPSMWHDKTYKDLSNDMLIRAWNRIVISNGTAKAEYYKELAEYCTWITFTIHSEFTNEKKFFDTVLETKQHADQIGCMVHVNIMDEHRNLLKNKKLKEFLTTKNISNYLHPIHDFEENKVAHPIKRLDEIYEYDTNPR
jgi:molybdenum cofactor biosynthesis enzyme MoaA